MKILIFSTAYLPFVGGAEVAIKEITDRLPAQAGIQDVPFALITARFNRSVPKHERIGNVDVYRVGFGTPLDKWLLPWLGLRKAEKLEKEERFDAIWCMMASQASVAAAWFKECFPKVRLVLTLQEGDEEAHLKRYVLGVAALYRLFIRPWHTLVFKRADAITAISNYLAKRARRINPDVPIEVVPNGVDVEKFKNQNAKSKIEEVRQTFGIGEQDKIVITTSRLVAKNGIGDLIAAFQFLPDNIKLVICGSGPLLKNLQLTTYNLRLTNRVRFVGHVPHDQLPSYLHVADLFCRPSRSEGMGISFIEAMAAGVPVVATPVGGIPDFLKDGETGLFCEVDDPKDIAERIRVLLSNDELRNRIVANASRMVLEQYAWSGITERMKYTLIRK